MPNFKRVEVLFGAADPASMKTVSQRSGPVQAIFFKGAEQAFFKNFDPSKVKKIQKAPTGVTVMLDGQPAPANFDSGPGEVCYLIGGQLHCWEQ